MPNDTLSPSPSTDDTIDSQPLERLQLWGAELVILGTAHVSRASVQAVEQLLATEVFDAVAIELCETRAAGIRDPDQVRQMDLFQVIRQGKVGMVAASLALAAFQRRLAERLDIEPGAEMRAAMDGAESRAIPYWLIDREVGTTLRRAWRGVRFRERLVILSNLAGSLFSKDDPEQEDIEALKNGDMLESAFAEFAQDASSLYTALIDERDTYMAARLQQQIEINPEIHRVLVVIGAGHLSGLVKQLQKADSDPVSKLQKLDRIPPAPSWPKWLAFGTVAAVFALIGYAFYQSPQLGISALRDWIVLTGGLAAVGALAAGAHPITIVVSFVTAPFKPIRILPTGAFAAMSELAIRRPQVADFEALRQDLSNWRGWWRNRVARTLLIFILVNLGTIAGEYIAGIHILRAVL